MKTALSLLNSPHLKPSQRQRYMQLVNTGCDRQNSLITGLLELVQLDRVADRRPCSIPQRDCAWGCQHLPTTSPEKGVILAYTVSNELPAVSCLDAA